MTMHSPIILTTPAINLQERVKQEDGTISVMMVESLIKLDYNTGEWKKLQHIRRMEQNQQNDKKLSAQNSVVI